MTKTRDFIPQDAGRLRSFMLNLLCYVEKKFQEWEIPPEALEYLEGLYADFVQAFNAVCASPCPSTLLALQKTQGKVSEALQVFVEQFLEFPPVSDDDRTHMGIPESEQTLSKKKLVVLVDDNRVNLHFGKNALENAYTVVTASSAERLFSVLDAVDPALILLDVDMPEMNGFEAITLLKAKPQTRDIPVIFLTSRAGETDESRALALGAVDYIIKPYEPSLLIEKIETALTPTPA